MSRILISNIGKNQPYNFNAFSVNNSLLAKESNNKELLDKAKNRKEKPNKRTTTRRI